jgi:tRNA(adenine34) deaminase
MFCSDKEFMEEALLEARKAYNIGEVPVGCVLVKDNIVIARAYNLKETTKDALAHAEILALKKAYTVLGDWRLEDVTMYVTLEPCAMCASAITHSRIKRVVVGALDPKMGGCGSALSVLNHEKMNHKVIYETGLLKEKSEQLLKTFFKELRDRNKRRKLNSK